ncbi:MAG TPA: nitronate monooxygenase [Gemmatimonadaceae bacterium]
MSTSILQRVGFIHPVIQAPLAGGGDTPSLVAAVSNAGALGFIGAAYLTPEQIGEASREVRARTTRPFGINLFAPLPAPEASDVRGAMARVAPYFAELGLGTPPTPTLPPDSFDAQLAAALESGAAMFSFTFGLLPDTAVRAIKTRGLFLAGTATTPEEARLLERSGVDAVIAQGSEAGGHRGTFATTFEAGMIGTMSLVPQIVDAVGVPVIASGGIMDGRTIAATLALGAEAVQMGTAFLTCEESGIPDAYREMLLSPAAQTTRLTRAFSGRPARGIVNRFMREMEGDAPSMNAPSSDILSFPLQNALTRPLRSAAGKAGRAEFLSLWAGQAASLARRERAADLVARLAAELEAAKERLAPKS